MDFTGSSAKQCQMMLQELGITKIEELFEAIPSTLLCPAPLHDDGLCEWEGRKLIEQLASTNTFAHYDNYMGAGAYEHQIPAVVSAICSKSEFLTCYTPYQAEISQGSLQAIFEFQSAICALTGLQVSNASVYDGACAVAEAALMALRAKKPRRKLLLSRLLHPHYRAVLEQYVEGCQAEIITLPMQNDGTIDINQAASLIDDDSAALLYQSPNLLGLIEEGEQLCRLAHARGALAIVAANPLSYGLFKSAAEQGADIAVGDCQPLGIPLQFGGPYVGYIACTAALMRQLPGRIAGKTVDAQGKSGYVLTLQAREQHIRREKATSNICTNQALAALSSLIATLWYGPSGLKQLATANWQRTAYLKKELEKIPSIQILQNSRFFNEIVITFPLPIEEVCSHFFRMGICPGVSLRRWYPELGNALLACVTETKTLEQLNRYVEVAQMII